MPRLRITALKSAALLATLALASPLAAQDPGKTATTDTAAARWQFEVTPYFWVSGLSGTIGLGRIPGQEVSASFGDLLDHLTFAFMITGEVRRGRFGVLADAIYFNLNESDTTAPAGFSGTDVGFKQGLYTFGATFRPTRGRIPIDIVAGGRYAYLSTTIGLTAGALPARTQSASEGWWAPFIGVRAQLPLADKWSLTGYGDFGGFDGYANTQWQLLGAVNYDISKLLVARVGYRYISVEYIHDKLSMDMAYSGAFLGAGFRF
jgi:hypothetical protein